MAVLETTRSETNSCRVDNGALMAVATGAEHRKSGDLGRCVKQSQQLGGPRKKGVEWMVGGGKKQNGPSPLSSFPPAPPPW